jgi:hypothetical protein
LLVAVVVVVTGVRVVVLVVYLQQHLFQLVQRHQ